MVHLMTFIQPMDVPTTTVAPHEDVMGPMGPPGPTGIIGSDAGRIATIPSTGNYPVTNIYVDAATNTLVVQYDDSGNPQIGISSAPPGADYIVTNLYVDAGTGKLVTEYEQP